MASIPLRRALREFTLKAAQKAGFERVNLAPVDIRGMSLSSVAMFERSPARPFVVDMPVSRLRDLAPVGLSMPYNPFFIACTEYMRTGQTDYAISCFRRYYDTGPASVANLLLDRPSLSLGRVEQLSSLEVELPWFGTSGEEVKNLRLANAARHARENGGDAEAGKYPYILGPIAASKGEMELRRILKTFRSIREKGYLISQNSDHIRGHLLIGATPEEFCVLIMSGTHRAPALAALGHETVPMLIYPRNVYRLRDLERWPGVVSGDFTQDGASRVFDRIMSGQLPSFLADWKSTVAAGVPS